MDFLQFSSNYLISGQCSGWSWWIHIFTHRTTIVTDETRKVVVDCIDYMTMSWPYLLVSMVCSQFLALEVGPFVRDHPGIPRCAFACLCSCVSEKKKWATSLQSFGEYPIIIVGELLVACSEGETLWDPQFPKWTRPQAQYKKLLDGLHGQRGDIGESGRPIRGDD
jgi:hypothetical protein